MNFELRPIDRQCADFICRESGGGSSELWLAAALASNAVGNGDICLNLADIAGINLTIADEVVSLPHIEVLTGILRRAAAVGAPGGFCPLVLDDAGRLYLHRYWRYEQDLIRVLLEKAAPVESLREEILLDGLGRFFPVRGDNRPDWQALAAIAALRKRLCIISGGPGTGKTSTVVKILALMVEQHSEKRLKIALAAPTGKAAARLKESISRMKENLDCSDEVKEQIPAAVSTIHRLLGSINGSVRFRHNAENPLPHDVVIVDEASMVDLPLMAKLVTAIKGDGRLILLGDRDQLASVESGAVLGDLCGGGTAESFSGDFSNLVQRLCGAPLPTSVKGDAAARADTLVVLKKNYRFPATSGIGQLAGAINAGDVVLSMDLLRDENFADIAWRDLPVASALKKAIRPAILDGYRYYLEAETVEEALTRFDSFRVLCALREGGFGVTGITKLVEEILAENRLIDLHNRWYKGRPVIITVNDYSLKLYNGDVGIVFPDPELSGAPRVYFPAADGTIRKISPVRLPPHQTVYAMTVHKSQGSEFERLLMILPETDAGVLSRELIYTGITRAKTRVDLWGNRGVLEAAVIRRVERTSGLRAALWGS